MSQSRRRSGRWEDDSTGEVEARCDKVKVGRGEVKAGVWGRAEVADDVHHGSHQQQPVRPARQGGVLDVNRLHPRARCCRLSAEISAAVDAA